MNFYKSKCFTLPCLLAIGIGNALPAVADTVIDEIIVSANLRDVTLLDTAASITVIDAEVISQRQARHLEQLLNIAPNVNFSSGASLGRFIQVRGIG